VARIEIISLGFGLILFFLLSAEEVVERHFLLFSGSNKFFLFLASLAVGLPVDGVAGLLTQFTEGSIVDKADLLVVG